MFRGFLVIDVAFLGIGILVGITFYFFSLVLGKTFTRDKETPRMILVVFVV